jgi:hypothetical protein
VANLQYYADERVRWAALNGGIPRGAWAEVEEGIRRLAAAHSLPLRGIDIRPTSGCRHSKAGARRIVINMDCASWRIVAHEVAHTYTQVCLSPERRGYGWHNRVHRRITDRFCRWVLEQGWKDGSLAHELALAERARLEAPRAVAATPPPIEIRIAHRERQVKRLTTRIKSLTTRLKRARRSLASLIRSRDRQAIQEA